MDCNPVEGGICAWPTGYKWNSWAMAMNGDPRARQMYEFVYGDATEDWAGIVALHKFSGTVPNAGLETDDNNAFPVTYLLSNGNPLESANHH